MESSIIQQAVLKWRQDPASFDRAMLKIETFDPWEIEADRLYVNGKFTAIASGRGIGKTTYLARRMWHHAFCYMPSLSFMTGPKKDTVTKGLMPAVKMWFDRLPDDVKGLWTINSDSVHLTGREDLAQMLMMTASPHNPDALKGPRRHHMLVGGDEYSGIDDEIHKRLIGFLTTPYGRFLGMSQPTVLKGAFHGMFHKQRGKYQTMHVSSMESRHVDPGFACDVAAEYGKDSDDYLVDVLGQFPMAVSSSLVSLALIRKSMARERTEQLVRPVWGYDHAEGGDRCSLAKRQGCLQLERVEAWRERNPEVSCHRVADAYHETSRDMKPSHINVDATMIGGEAVRLMKRLRLPVRPVLVGLPAKDKRYADVRTWLAFRVREWLREDGVLLDDPELHSEMLGQTYGRTASGKRKLTVKEDDYDQSPDLWDGFMLTHAADNMDLQEVREAA